MRIYHGPIRVRTFPKKSHHADQSAVFIVKDICSYCPSCREMMCRAHTIKHHFIEGAFWRLIIDFN